MAGFIGNKPTNVPLSSADIENGSILNEDLAGSITDDKITGLSASKLTGALPAISGASLTSLPSDITKSTSEPAGDTNPSGGVGSLWLRTTTGEMYCCTDATTDSNVWTNIGEGTGSQPLLYMTATGGTIATDGNFKVHSFTSSGTFQVTQLGHIGTVEYLVVAGGGGGGFTSGSAGDSSGGGGAGAMRTASGFSVSATSYSITVGAGGAAHADGLDSVFSTITADGGGKGGTFDAAGTAGGSGGGGATNQAGGATTNASYGNAGGTGVTGDTSVAGGGGGAGGVGLNGGSNPSGTTQGDGGPGLANSITGSSVIYAAGGGAGSHNANAIALGGSGGIGGDGGTASVNPTAGDANTGSGGGAGGGQGAAGGSGIVIIRYQFQA